MRRWPEATAIVRKLYDARARANHRQGAEPLQGKTSSDYFTADIVALLRAEWIDAHPLYGVQEFNDRVTRVAADPEQPMLRGMVCRACPRRSLERLKAPLHRRLVDRRLSARIDTSQIREQVVDVALGQPEHRHARMGHFDTPDERPSEILDCVAFV